MSEIFFNRLEAEIKSIRSQKLYRAVKLYPNCKLNLCSNDYFQLRKDPRVIAGSLDACKKFGTGSGASPLLSGYLPCHQSLLEQLKKWKNKSNGMLFNTGYIANQSILKYLPGKKDLILADKLVHHSIIQAICQGSAKFKRFNHIDLDHLQDLLKANINNFETIFLVTESVYSMDGDYPDLKKLIKIKKEYPFILILDEAHGTGVFGRTGAGLAEEMGVQNQVDIIIGTLGKALGSMGAYVLSNSDLVIDYLVNKAGEFIYSTFLSPAQVGSAEVAIKILRTADKERAHLQNISRYFRELMGLNETNKEKYSSPIVPIRIKDPENTVKLRNHLLQKGIMVGSVRPPTVPPNTSRLRISLHTGLTQSHLEEVSETIKAWLKP